MALSAGTLSPERNVPTDIERPEYVGRKAPTPYTGPEVKDAETIERMRVAGRIAADALVEVARHIAPGVTTDTLDRIGHDYMCDHGAYPSTLGYRGFPKSLCTSINEVICHGIPDSRPMRELKGFERVTLQPGETQTVRFQLGPDELSYWSTNAGGWLQDAAAFDVWVGSDSLATLHASFEVVA